MKIRCPICKSITTWEENPWRPFCSERCRLIDLGAWASGEYRIPGEEINKGEISDGHIQEDSREEDSGGH
ncbi:MAG TPA: DNA gyrase inhibitor YacG [Nitrospirae bacterium]|nr:DNA gyrase inhibitor YacG [Nitrospirota bacterium]